MVLFASAPYLKTILQVTRYCHAKSFGGIERYVQELNDSLRARGWRSQIVWLCGPGDVAGQAQDGILRLEAPGGRADFPTKRDRERLEVLINKEQPHLVHFHTFGEMEAHWSRKLVTAQIPHFYSYHTASCSCRRTSLLLWGEGACDGRILGDRCAACKVNERTGIPPRLSMALVRILKSAERFGLRSSRVVRLSRELEHYGASFAAFLQSIALVFTQADWAIPILKCNGAPETNILRLPQGVGHAFRAATIAKPPHEPGNRCIIAYIGRLDNQKGPELVIEAFKTIESSRASLWIIGCEQANAFQVSLEHLARNDARITFKPKVPYQEMPLIYQQVSVVVVPSKSFETGPFVVREALAMGVPVIASSYVGEVDLLRRLGTKVLRQNTVACWREALVEMIKRFEEGNWPPIQPVADIPSAEGVYSKIADEYERVL